jgi:ubiquinone/menaquinone biosynthesis C-methylase UbiE
VTGLDATASYCAAAAELSRWLGLGDRTAFQQGSAVALPYCDGAFDVAWTEHVQMNIVDKRAFYGEIARVLRPGGRYLFHEIFAGGGGDLHFPVPWADDASLSLLGSAEEARSIMEDLGFAVRFWIDKSEQTRRFVEAGRRRPKVEPPPISLHLLLGQDARRKFHNLVRNLNEDRIALLMGVLYAPAS